MKFQYLLLVLLGMAAFTCFLPVSAEEIGSNQGWYVIHCNVYGANIYLDDKFIGTVPDGALTVPVNITCPYQKLTVKKSGYSTFIDSITKVPAEGNMVDLYATLWGLPSVTQAEIIRDVGWYIVHSNVDGATVMFDKTEKGEISQGVVYVPVYSTATPFHSDTVKKDGYTSFTRTIDRVPLRGELLIFMDPSARPTLQRYPLQMMAEISAGLTFMQMLTERLSHSIMMSRAKLPKEHSVSRCLLPVPPTGHLLSINPDIDSIPELSHGTRQKDRQLTFMQP